ncbi:hypothetical protein A0H81_14174 [Grifola frondosa]|uniref:Uncharacterized protein n=1 Tax=Grifola frondosa TaxID=5627 RepID=A0A1C7LPQ0_GRIFR|nr:hypothetical protein A0H81_14174 [Grifola frondosa]
MDVDDWPDSPSDQHMALDPGANAPITEDAEEDEDPELWDSDSHQDYATVPAHEDSVPANAGPDVVPIAEESDEDESL